ncbi:MAG: indole-3-glycerol phosphate synthase TrpC [Planctomycetaceae bacterium]
MQNVLKTIVEHKRTEIEAAKSRIPFAELETQLADAPPVRDFIAALRQAKPLGLIAEVKKASPSAGLIRENFDPVNIARIYEKHGAACLSVLTDEKFFQGHLDFLRDVRRAVSIPVMRKEFTLDRYQVLEARIAGADCVLLIAECLDDESLADLFHYATELGMASLIEIYEPDNLERVLKLNPPLLGINNRNLRTFVTDLAHTFTLAKNVPPETLLVSESGIRTHNDVTQLADANIGAILVGETLMRSPDIGEAVRQLMGTG